MDHSLSRKWKNEKAFISNKCSHTLAFQRSPCQKPSLAVHARSVRDGSVCYALNCRRGKWICLEQIEKSLFFFFFLGSPAKPEKERDVTSDWRSFDLTTPGQRSECTGFSYSLLPQAECKQAVSRDQRESRMSVLCILLRSRRKPYNSPKQKSVAFSSLNRISNMTPFCGALLQQPAQDRRVYWLFSNMRV